MRKLIVVLLLLALAYAAWFHETRWPVRTSGDPPQPLIIAQGAGVLDIGRQLQQLGLVRHPEVFRVYVVSRGRRGRLRAGEYSLEGRMSLEQIVDKIVRGDVVRHTVTFPEGMSLEDMARIAAIKGIPAEAFLAAARNPAPIQDLDPDAKDLEGYLFPDTYDIPRGPDPAGQLVARMVRRFREVIAPELPAVAQSGRTLRQIVTLASIVETETARPEERPRVAAVFLNRLQKRMPLQTDPTVIYALRKAGTYDGNIRTRRSGRGLAVQHLPLPGAAAGADRIPRARVAAGGRSIPRPSRELYFVSRNDGSHQFSESLSEHERWVTQYQRHRRAVAAGSPLPASPGLPLPASPAASAVPAAPSPRP